MIPSATRAICAMLGLIGAAGLVMFADPAAATAARPVSAPATIAAAGPIATAPRG